MSPGRAARGKNRGRDLIEEENGGTSKSGDNGGDEEEDVSDDREEFEDESAEDEAGEMESEFEASDEGDEVGDDGVPPPPKRIGGRPTGLELANPAPPKKLEKGSGGVGHTRKGESSDMERELRMMKRRAEAEEGRDEGVLSPKKARKKKVRFEDEATSEGDKKDGKKKKKEGEKAKETSADIKEGEFGKVREAVNASVIGSLARIKKKKKKGLSKVNEMSGVKKKKEKDGSSDDDEEEESDDDEDEDFGVGSSGIEADSKKVRLHKGSPGVLSRKGLWRMNEAVRAVSGGRPERNKDKKKEETPASAVAYLNLCFLRAHEGKPPAKGKIREMETLAYVLDRAAEGDIGGAMDIAFGRLQALDVSHEDGWGTAEHLEVAPKMKYSATSEGERQAAAKLEEAKRKREKLIRSMGTVGDGGSPVGGKDLVGKGTRKFRFQYRPPWSGWRGRGGGGKGRGKKQKGR